MSGSLGMFARRLLLAGTAAGAAAAGYYATADVPTKFQMASASGPIVRALCDAETAHKIGIFAAKWGMFPKETRPDPPELRVQLWGKTFSNPIGLAAGFDKDAEAMEAMLGLGFGFMEVGSITPKPQPGNPQPRIFRLPEHGAVINRYGFNSEGAEAAAARLEAFRKKAEAHPDVKPGVLAVNLGKNKTSEDAAADYVYGMTRLGHYADFVVINVSSPNTPGLRTLQGRKALESLVGAVKSARDSMEWGPAGPPPLLVKIAPDLQETDKQDIAAVATKLKIDGLVVSNTTIARPPEVAAHAHGKETGGLSGRPLFESSTAVLRDMYRLTGGKLPIIGCGGVASGEDAYAKIRAGASLVELYTAFAYEGPALVPRLKAQLADCLKRDGFATIADAVGADHRKAAAVVDAKAAAPAKKKGWW